MIFFRITAFALLFEIRMYLFMVHQKDINLLQLFKNDYVKKNSLSQKMFTIDDTKDIQNNNNVIYIGSHRCTRILEILTIYM